ncbi:MAG TPA: DUF2804 domain-containing protein [Eubacteriales bacterium]|nr:DUF2804 domain-containing protein [Eubacteriales bacterium]
MSQHRLSEGKLLNEKGNLCEAGYAFSLVKAYDRNDVKAGKVRIKEWDYYLIFNKDYAIALTIDDNGYMGLISASFLDFGVPFEHTETPMFWFPLGEVGFPNTSSTGDVQKELKGCKAAFKHTEQGRILTLHLDRFDGDEPLDVDILLTDEPQDSMVIATPFDKAGHFYYNQKIVAMRAQGSVSYKGKLFSFDHQNSFGLLDWGRGVWTYENTWYWSAAQGEQSGHVVGFNLGYGFGDTKAASENMVFVDGKAHKLEGVDFGIPHKDGKDDFMSPWHFTSTDGRLDLVFTPIIDRASDTNVLVIRSNQHQVFGRFSGKLILDDGSEFIITELMGFAEKVMNRW